MLVNATFEGAVDQILDVAERFSAAVQAAGIPCRVIGGLAVYLHVDEIDPLVARLTRDVDVAVDPSYLDRLIAAVEPLNFRFRHVAGVDMFVDAKKPQARSAIHMVFVGEKIRPEYIEPIPVSPAVLTSRGILIAPSPTSSA